MSTFHTAVGTVFVLCFLLFLRLIYITPALNPVPPEQTPKHRHRHLLVVLGSGGHTAEALSLLSSIDIFKFTQRTYVVSSGDAFSARKATEFEQGLFEKSVKNAAEKQPWGAGRFEVREIPRARRVGQSWLSTPLSCLACLAGCFAALWGGGGGGRLPDLVVCNGPGSAVMVVGACFVYKFLGVAQTRTIYVESFARVSSLSLSGKILYPFVNRFLVQWPGLVSRYPRAEYHGVLV
ncbi:oligosaccharide biosynthesis protein Alg14-like protein [Peziza echinospora]|nr:oligosaccharide biosynthesis protein Alg14-like protein [Peziza echinospora]